MAITLTLIDGSQIYGKSVTNAQIEDKTVTTQLLADGAITNTQIASGTIVTSNLADGAVTADKIANNTITSAQIATGTITANEITDGTITDTEISAGAGIQTAKLADGALFVKSDGTVPMDADLNMGGYKVINLTTDAPTADSDAANKKYVDDTIGAALTAALIYKGTWDPALGMPTSPKRGDYYKISADGTAVINGEAGIEVKANDGIVFNGTTWDKIDNTENYTASNGVQLTGLDFALKLANDTLVADATGVKYNYSQEVYGERLESQFNGTARTFYVAYEFEANSLRVFYNGVRLDGDIAATLADPINNDYIFIPAQKVIKLNNGIKAPIATKDKMLCDYRKKITVN